MRDKQIGRPGSEIGPCPYVCGHTDCAEEREVAVKICRLCREEIGYERKYNLDPANNKALAHADCIKAEAGKKRSCFYCQNHWICFLRRDVDKGITGTNMLNIDGDGAPGRMLQIFDTLANACTKFVFDEDR